MQLPSVDDPTTARALDSVTAAVTDLQSIRDRDHLTADLIVGTNKIQHGLGRAPIGYTITPTVADATFAHAINKSNPRPELELWITVVGVGQPGAAVEVW